MSVGNSGRALLLLLIFCGCASRGYANEQQFQELWYSASVNHSDVGVTVLVLEADSEFFIRQIDLALLGISIPQADPLRYQSELYYPAQSLQSHVLSLDRFTRRAYFVSVKRPHLQRPPSDDLLLTVTANGRTLVQPQYVRYEDGELLLPESTMQAMGIAPPKIWTPNLSGDMPLHSVAGENFIVNYRNLSLDATLLANVLETSRLNVTQHRAKSGTDEQDSATIPVTGGIAAVFNYQVTSGYTSERGTWTSGFYDASIGTDNTTCHTEYLDSSDAEAGWFRLTTNCIYDWPDQRLSAVIGDVIGGNDQLTQPVRYAGIRLGTDFGLQPTLLTIPSQALSGIVGFPSMLEVWVDQALVLRTEIPAGPFEVHDIPLRTGAGDVRAFVTPPFGKQQVLSYGFYADSSLLAKGLSDWSVEAGKLRENFTSSEDTYGESFGAVNLRYGLANSLTAGLGVQVTETFELASLSAAFTLGHFAAVDATVAGSQDNEDVTGSAYRARLSHQSRYINASYSIQRNSEGYQELAYLNLARKPETIRRTSLGFSLGGGVSLSYIDSQQRYFDGSSSEFQSAGLNLRLGRFGNLLISTLLPQDSGAEKIYTAQLTIPLGNSHSASASGYTDGTIQRQEIGIQKNMPAGPGYGYRFNFGDDGTTSTGMADLQLQNSIGRVSLQGFKFGETETASVQASGSVVVSGEGIELSRRSSGSYAIVEVGAPDIPVYHGGQLKAYTNKEGKALVSGLRPYENNVISIRAEDVPLNVQPQALSANVKPGRREVVTAAFKFQRERYVTGRLQTVDGKVIPAGSVIHIAGGGESIVGQGGQFFVSVSGDKLGLEVILLKGQCILDTPLATDKSTVVTDLGQLTCRRK